MLGILNILIFLDYIPSPALGSSKNSSVWVSSFGSESSNSHDNVAASASASVSVNIDAQHATPDNPSSGARAPYVCGSPSSICDISSSRGDTSDCQGDASVCQSDASSSHGETSSSHGDTSSSPEDTSSSQGDTSSSHGETSSSHGDTSSSHGDTSSSHGDTSSSHGDTSSSHGEAPASHGNPFPHVGNSSSVVTNTSSIFDNSSSCGNTSSSLSNESSIGETFSPLGSICGSAPAQISRIPSILPPATRSNQIISSATRTGLALGNNSANARSTVSGSIYTTICSQPTKLSYSAQNTGLTITISKATTLTLTNCPCTFYSSTAAKKEHKSSKHDTATKSAKLMTLSGNTQYGNGTLCAECATGTTVVSSYVTYCSTGTTFAINGGTYTATGREYLTVTNCPCTVPKSIGESSHNTSNTSSEGMNTVTVTSPIYTTVCVRPTTFVCSYKSTQSTISVTKPTTLTFTNCPCTFHDVKPTEGLGSRAHGSMATVTGSSAGNTKSTTVSAYVTYCPTATTFTTNGGTYTATNSQYVTITNCPCTVPQPPETKNASNAISTVVSNYTTYFSSPTTFTTNGKTYTASAPTTLTITECPCTIETLNTIQSTNFISSSISGLASVTTSQPLPTRDSSPAPESTTWGASNSNPQGPALHQHSSRTSSGSGKNQSSATLANGATVRALAPAIAGLAGAFFLV